MKRVLRNLFLMGAISAVVILLARIGYDLVDTEKAWHKVQD